MLSTNKDESNCFTCWNTGVVTHWEDGCVEVRETCGSCGGKGYTTPCDLERERRAREASREGGKTAMRKAEEALNKHFDLF